MIEVCAQQGWSVERKITKEHAKESQNVLTKNILKGGKVIQECLDNVITKPHQYVLVVCSTNGYQKMRFSQVCLHHNRSYEKVVKSFEQIKSQ